MYYVGYATNIFDIFYHVFSLLKLTCMTLNILNKKILFKYSKHFFLFVCFF